MGTPGSGARTGLGAAAPRWTPPRRWSWTSTRRWWRFTANTKPARRRITKGGYGFHPLLCFSDDGDALGAVLRPGNAAANNIDDHIALLDAAIGRLPEAVAAGHRAGDAAALVARAVVLRTDSAGCSTKIAAAARDRNVGFSLVARRNDAIDSAIAAVPVTDKCWQRAIRRSGDVRPGAAVADLTEFVDTADWPKGTRLIVRREPRHPGAQRSLFPSDNWRYWGHWTDQEGPAAERDAHMRAHAVVEDHIAALKTSGLTRLPFGDFDANAAWVALVCWARTLVVWFQQLACAARHPRQSRRQTPPLDPLAHPRTPHPLRGAEPPSAYPPTTPAQRTSPASTTTSTPSPESPPEGTKHHNRHHEPPGGPTPRAPTPTTNPKQHPTGPQHPAQTPQQHPTPRPKDPNKNQTTPPNHSHEQSGLVGRPPEPTPAQALRESPS